MNKKLKPLHFLFQRNPVLLCVIDGIGIAPENKANAFFQAKTPYLDWLKKNAHYGEIGAHGHFVGLPSDVDIGNSEVGHNTLGSGRKLPQGASLVNEFLNQKKMRTSASWKSLINHVHSHQSKLHFMGLLSDGNVHSHVDHLKILLEEALREDIRDICLHLLLDGRDVKPRSAETYLEDLEKTIENLNKKYESHIRIASCGGRQVMVMDRYNANWDLVKRGWDVYTQAQAEGYLDVMEGLKAVRKTGSIDQDLEPFVLLDAQGEPQGLIKENDAVFNFNFRGDRMIEISRVFEEDTLLEMEKKISFKNVYYMGMILYDGDTGIPKNHLISPLKIEDPMGKYLVDTGLSLFAISETQKYGHVTYFWNGNKSGKLHKKYEEYVEIPSDKISFDQKPRMKADEITDKTIELLRSKKYQTGRINFPNGDMVGHTGNLKASILSVEAVDENIGRLKECMDEIGGVLIIVADHGNCEEMLDSKGDMKTAHTTNLVPLYIYDPQDKGKYFLNIDSDSGLSNLASTVFHFLGYEPPEHYDHSLIKFRID